MPACLSATRTQPQSAVWRTSNPLKKTLEITPNLEALFGTRDENLHIMEDALDVSIDLRSNGVAVEGAPESVDRVENSSTMAILGRCCGL